MLFNSKKKILKLLFFSPGIAQWLEQVSQEITKNLASNGHKIILAFMDYIILLTPLNSHFLVARNRLPALVTLVTNIMQCLLFYLTSI